LLGGDERMAAALRQGELGRLERSPTPSAPPADQY